MNILIAGGTGFIGTYLRHRFEKQGDIVKIVSRNDEHIAWKINDLAAALENTDVLINLAGKSINCRHITENKVLILNSRINTTQLLGKAIEICKNPPLLWINASASAIYKPSEVSASVESSTDFANDFLANVVRQWENVFFDFKLPSTRQIALRTSVVLGHNSGVFPTLYNLVRYGLGGKVGNGRQMFSWIHIEDYFRIIMFLSENLSIKSVVNCTSPSPLSNEALMKRIRFHAGMVFGLPAPTFAVKIGAILIGTESDLLLNSCYLFPEVLMNAQFKFKFPTIDSAVTDLLKKN